MANRIQFIIWLVHFSLYVVRFLMHRLEECCVYFHKPFPTSPWFYEETLFFFFSVVNTECVFGSD